jgi:hypothetical protein
MMLADDLGLQGLRSAADTDAMHCTTTSHECSSSAAEPRFHPVQGIRKQKKKRKIDFTFVPTYPFT